MGGSRRRSNKTHLAVLDPFRFFSFAQFPFFSFPRFSFSLFASFSFGCAFTGLLDRDSRGLLERPVEPRRVVPRNRGKAQLEIDRGVEHERQGSSAGRERP